MGLERVVEIRPAFDRRHKDPKKNYGIGGVEFAFYLKGEKGVIQFLLMTHWLLPETQKELDEKEERGELKHSHFNSRPLPADLGYHSPTPRYEGQQAMDCTLIPGGKCYYDGSGLRAYDVYKAMLEKGDEGVWEMLESEYRCTFERGGHAHECGCASSEAYTELR